MARNQVRITKDPTGPFAWQRNWRAIACWPVSAGLAGLSWYSLHAFFSQPTSRTLFAANLLGLAVVHGALALALERGLAWTALRQTWRYRTAFLTSAGFALAQLAGLSILAQMVPASMGTILGWLPATTYTLLAAAAGAFAGGVAATGLNEGFWENNSPPAGRIQAEVRLQHLLTIGDAPAVPLAKRLFDIFLALLGLVLSSPGWALFTVLLWLEDPGPILFVKNSVGKGGYNFHQFKFRTMVRGAEEHTGPVLAQEEDERILKTGRLLRKTALDELPQLINILIGEMSFVGPRPQRTVLVHDYLEKMPEYAERHKVLPGLAGLAQVAGDYYLTPRQKLRFDRLYIRYVSLAFDLKLLCLAFLITFWFRWRPGWRGRLPRNLLHSTPPTAPRRRSVS